MAKLLHNNKVVLNNMKYATDSLSISVGLMLAGKKKIAKGMCLVLPVKKDVRHGASVTMLFCFHKMEILFINTKFEVVEKKILLPWTPSYTPKKPCKYVIESLPETFKNIKIGDKVSIEKL
jgi:uncharacterized membrane protein (UPF0127 family)